MWRIMCQSGVTYLWRIMCQSGATYLWRIMCESGVTSVEDNVSVEQNICGG